ncbi:hypothetical protein J8273_7540 [Carpediemonas membranifera]|uniref:Uncharacterized protein n=1 Tax=Carpediemonas membranifera TaxID=201153 RepID=A0A8J6BVB9_9EUKA|nr:hypothetical protein J8273_7540 [Carpediemonas membranifera]|eukprot:KAG9391266.1 hypothetical protein J8273_7540 [Carpediemonas membranifera]
MECEEYIQKQLSKTGFARYSQNLFVRQQKNAWIEQARAFIEDGQRRKFIPIHGLYSHCRELMAHILSLVTPSNGSTLCNVVDLVTVIHSRFLPSGEILMQPMVSVSVIGGYAAVKPVLSLHAPDDADGSISGVLVLGAMLGHTEVGEAMAAMASAPQWLIEGARAALPLLDVAEADIAATLAVKADPAVERAIHQALCDELCAAIPPLPCDHEVDLDALMWPRELLPSTEIPFHVFLTVMRDRALLDAHVPFCHTYADQEMLDRLELAADDYLDLAPAAAELVQARLIAADMAKFSAFLANVDAAINGIELDDGTIQWLDAKLTTAEGTSSLTLGGVKVAFPQRVNFNDLGDIIVGLPAMIIPETCLMQRLLALQNPIRPLDDGLNGFGFFLTGYRGRATRPLLVWSMGGPPELRKTLALAQEVYPVRMDLDAVIRLVATEESAAKLADITPDDKFKQFLAAMTDEGIKLGLSNMVVIESASATVIAMTHDVFADIQTVNGLDFQVTVAPDATPLSTAPQDRNENAYVTPYSEHAGMPSQSQLAVMETVLIHSKDTWASQDSLKCGIGIDDTDRQSILSEATGPETATDSTKQTPRVMTAERDIATPPERIITNEDRLAMQEHVGWGRCFELLQGSSRLLESLGSRLDKFESNQQAVLEEVRGIGSTGQVSQATNADMDEVVAMMRASLDMRQSSSLLPMPTMLADITDTSSDTLVEHAIVKLRTATDRGDVEEATLLAEKLAATLLTTDGLSAAMHALRTAVRNEKQATPSADELRGMILEIFVWGAELVIRNGEGDRHTALLVGSVTQLLKAHSFTPQAIGRALLNTENPALVTILEHCASAVISTTRLLTHPTIFNCTTSLLSSNTNTFQSVLSKALTGILGDGLLLNELSGSNKTLPSGLGPAVEFLFRAGFFNMWDGQMLYCLPSGKSQRGLVALAVDMSSSAKIMPGLVRVLDCIIARLLTAGISTEPAWTTTMCTTVRLLLEAAHSDLLCAVPKAQIRAMRTLAQEATLMLLATYFLALGSESDTAHLQETLRVAFLALPEFAVITQLPLFDKAAVQTMRDAAADKPRFGQAVHQIVGGVYSRISKKSTLKTKIQQTIAASPLVRREASIINIDVIVGEALKKGRPVEVDSQKLQAIGAVILEQTEELRAASANTVRV